jgi:large conductance mechanosensitive channel
MLKEFKDFILKGNAFDLAIGVIIAGAFGLVVKSLVDNIIMPLIAGIFKMPDFSNMFYALHEGATDSLEISQKAGPTLAYGVFINNVINLVIVGFALFVAVKIMSQAMKKEEAVKEAPKPSNEEVLLGEIRDLLKKK